jgi:hypothetical protein
MGRFFITTACLAAAFAVPQAAQAEEAPPLARAPATTTPPAVTLAVSYELKFRLPAGTALAELLMQAGVDADDSTAADRLSAGHDAGGGFVRVSISKPLGSNDYRLQRLTLMTDSSQTVMERRDGALAISSTGSPAKRRNTLV